MKPVKPNVKQTRSRVVSIEMFEASCVKTACEEAIERYESGIEGSGMIKGQYAIDLLENFIDKVNALPYFTAPARNKGRDAKGSNAANA